MLKISKNTKVDFSRTPISEINNLNQILTTKMDWTPEVGMMGTEYVGSDRYAVVCTEILSPKRINIATLYGVDEDNIKTNEDITVDKNGVMWYEAVSSIRENDKKKYSLRKDKSWQKSGGTSSRVYFGVANPYRDPSF